MTDPYRRAPSGPGSRSAVHVEAPPRTSQPSSAPHDGYPAPPPIGRRPGDGLTRPLVSERYSRVTVVLPGGGRITVSLPSRVPLTEVADLVVRDLQLGDVLFPPVWTFGEVGRPAIPPMSTLADAGVLDGAVLEVRDAAADEVGEALVLDVAEMVRDTEDQDGLGRWTPGAAARTIERVGYVGAVLAALAGLRVPEHGHGTIVVGVVTLLLGLVLLGAANLRHRGPRPSPADAVLAAWCAVAVLGVATRYSATAGELVTRVAAGVALAALLACAAVPVLAVVGPATALVAAAVTTAVLAGTGAGTVGSAAVAGTLGALLVTVAPALAGRLGALVPSAITSPEWSLPGGRIPAVRRSAEQARWEQTMRARVALAVGQVHVVLVTACILGAVVVAGAEFELAGAASVYAASLSGVLALTVLLRAVPARRAADGTALLVGGTAAAFVVLAVLPGRAAAPWLGPVLALVVVLALVAAGLAVATRDTTGATAETSVATQSTVLRATRAASVLLLAVSVVLTVGSFGVFEHFWHMGRSL